LPLYHFCHGSLNLSSSSEGAAAHAVEGFLRIRSDTLKLGIAMCVNVHTGIMEVRDTCIPSGAIAVLLQKGE
jgi:hypothetical protein